MNIDRVLFDEIPLDPAAYRQSCDRCQIVARASDDSLRVRGWQVYDGTSFTGQPLNVRICPACQRSAS